MWPERWGLGSATLFYSFKDKASIFRAAFEQYLSVAEEIAEPARNADDPFATILDIIADLGADATEPGAEGMVVEIIRRAGQASIILQEALARIFHVNS